MSEPMSKERLDELEQSWGRWLYANGSGNISELITEIRRCHAELEDTKNALRYVAYNRLPSGDMVMDHLPLEWQHKVHKIVNFPEQPLF